MGEGKANLVAVSTLGLYGSVLLLKSHFVGQAKQGFVLAGF